MPSLEWNKYWDKSYPWSQHGDEWVEHAQFCGVPYDKWKDSLAKYFLINPLQSDFTVLEIGAGHGRWSALIPERIPKGTLHLVEFSQTCIDFCKKRLAQYNNIKYWTNDGRGLPFLDKDSINYAWSFDSFVHIEEPEVRSYARELFRVMKPQAMGAIHHCGNPTPEQRQNGARSKVSGVQFRQILQDAGFFVIRQVDSWDGGNIKMAGDVISVFAKP